MKIYELSTIYANGKDKEKLFYQSLDKCEEVFDDRFLTLRSSLILQNGDNSIKEHREECEHPLIRSMIIHHINKDKSINFVCLQISEYDTED